MLSENIIQFSTLYFILHILYLYYMSDVVKYHYHGVAQVEIQQCDDKVDDDNVYNVSV